jgi:SAM-dependent methyltransferase
MNASVDFFYNNYANFGGQVLSAIRAETFGQDIGQNSWLTVDEYDRFIERLDITAGSHVLEVASGSGGPALYLARKTGCEITGVDINPYGISAAGNKVTSSGDALRVRFRMADASTLPFPTTSSSAAVHRFDELFEAAREPEGMAARFETGCPRGVYRSGAITGLVTSRAGTAPQSQAVRFHVAGATRN